MSEMFALERYGGSSRRDVAQIFDNLRNDGMPPLVVVPPSQPVQRTSAGTYEAVPEMCAESPAYYGFSRTFQAISRWNERKFSRKIASLILDLPLLGLNDPNDLSTPKSVREAMIDYLTPRDAV